MFADLSSPPVLGVIGISGSGKSTTVSALFHQELAFPPTSQPSQLPQLMRRTCDNRRSLRLAVVDAPDMGEDMVTDGVHLAMYDRAMPGCDVVLWVLAARNRALALERAYLRRLGSHADRIVFGLNQVDLVEPRDWNLRLNCPSDRQATRIADIAEHRRYLLAEVLGRDVTVTPYSACTGFGLHAVFAALTAVLPPHRRELFAALRRRQHPGGNP